MNDHPQASEPLDPPSGLTLTPRGILRRIVLPVIVIGVIVAAILWLESRGGGDVSPTGEEYGPVALPDALRTAGLDVGVEEGNLAPDFLLGTLDSNEIRLSDLRGKAVVLNFWATWCAPCRQEIPQFVAAHKQFSPDGLVIIGVNMQEGNSIARPYAEDFGMQFPIAIDVDGEVGDEYRLLGLPMTYFIDSDGVIRSVFTGPFQAQERDREVRGAIEQSDLEQRISLILSSGSP
jgi:peroxiredoxin